MRVGPSETVERAIEGLCGGTIEDSPAPGGNFC